MGSVYLIYITAWGLDKILGLDKVRPNRCPYQEPAPQPAAPEHRQAPQARSVGTPENHRLISVQGPVKPAAVPTERIERAILLLRDHKVMLDADLATLYAVETRVLVQAVKRNLERFPQDFMFQLDAEEVEVLRSQSVISKSGRGGRRTAPYAFTEEGVAMLSSVLHSPRAVHVNIAIMRAFVGLRRMLGSSAELARKLDALENKYDGQFEVVFEAIRELMAPSPAPRRRIGFYSKA